MNQNSHTYDIDDWEIISDSSFLSSENNKSNLELNKFIESLHIENIYNENWYDTLNQNLSNLNINNNISNTKLNIILNNRQDSTSNYTYHDECKLYIWDEKNVKEIIKDAKISWNNKLKNKKYKKRNYKRKMS
jgi:hypothetical protein